MDKWKGKYRIPSARAAWWDYANDGAYFITICTHARVHHFGICSDGQMKLTTIGAIVQGFWYEIPKHFPFVELGAFVVMPNHIHGILILNKNGDTDNVRANVNANVEIGHCPISNIGTETEIGQCPISTSDNPEKIPPHYRFRNQGKHTVSSIIGSFKSICTKHIHKTFPEISFEWQKLFWDNIIKDAEAYHNINNYIINNPKNWEKDRFFL